MDYGELHSHDEWSLLDAVGSARHGAERAAELGHPFLAKTNHASLSGVVHHMRACEDVGILPIVAVEAYYRPRRFPQDKTNWEYFHMVLLAKDLRGWRSLKLLTSQAYRDGWYRKPCIDDELLERWHEGLIISTSCVRGYVPQMIMREDEAAAAAHMDRLDRWVGEDWYFELQPHDFDDLRVVNRGLPALSVARSRPLVAARDAHAPTPEWIKTQHVSVAIRTKKTMVERLDEETGDDDRYDMMVPDTCYIGAAAMTIDDLQRYHGYLPDQVIAEAVRNTGEIASRCTPFMLNRSPKIPRYHEDPEAAYRQLRDLVYEGLKQTGHRHDKVYEDQVEHELEILRSKDFCDVFLIVWDFIRWARSTDPLPYLVVDGMQMGEADDSYFRYTEAGGGRERPMLVSIRGSAGASLVSYALRITTINPITWKLIFERFLNPDRVGMPDFDLDFAPGDADLVKEYIKRNTRYGGRDRVYDMVAHGTLAAKAAIGRVARAYGVPHPEIIAATKLIDKDDNDSDVADLRKQIVELDRFFDRHPATFEHACRLQRQVGTISEHAAGIILSRVPLDELVPVMKKAKADDYMVTAFGDEAESQVISSLGLWKLDLLVVIELAKIGYAIELVAKHHDFEFSLDALPGFEDPYDVDQRVMETFRRGLTMGIFQYGGSPSIASLTKKMVPEHMLHLSAINAVHRTATMTRGIHMELVQRRHDPSRIEYWDPSIVDVLEESYGLMIYQEQVMEVMIRLGGFSPARADSVRKIMSKYYRAHGDLAEQMLGAHKEDFVSNAASIVHGGRQTAEEIWEFCGGFSEYSFNKPHAGQYALLGYVGGALKTYWPDCLYASLLTFPPAKIRKPEERKPFYERVAREGKLLGVEVLPPDVNESELGFTIAPAGLRFGLGSINGLGPASVRDIVAGRPYDSLEHLVSWTSRKGAKANAGSRKALGGAGALDRWGVRDDLTDEERADAEEARLGIALSVPDRIGDLREPLARLIHSQAEVEEAENGDLLVVGGEVIGGREIATKYGNKMAKLDLAFGADEYRISIRPKLWEHAQEKGDDGEVLRPSVRDLVATDKALIVRGTKDKAYDVISVDAVDLAESVVREMEAAA